MALLCWLCLAQLCLPLLGKLHDISHLYARALQTAAVSATASAAERDSSDTVVSPGHGAHDLFGKHSEADCQGFSHMALGAGLLSHSLQAPLLRAVHAVRCRTRHHARRAQLPDAPCACSGQAARGLGVRL